MAGLCQCTLDEPGEIGAAFSVVAGLAEFGDRLRELALLSQGDAEPVVCHGVVRFEPNHRSKFGDRIIRLLLLEKAGTEVVVGLGEVGLHTDC